MFFNSLSALYLKTNAKIYQFVTKKFIKDEYGLSKTQLSVPVFIVANTRI